MNRQALLGAVLTAVLGALLLVLYLRRFEQEKSGGDPVRVLVVTKSVARGKPVTDEVLAVREIPIAYVDNRTIKASEREKVVGLRTLAPLEAQNVLMWNDLAVSVEERRDLSSLVTPGFRAVYIRAIREDQGSPLINPGDYVDVIATLPQGDARMERSTAIVLLQKVLVLASGGKTSPDEGPPPTDKRAPPPREQGLTLSLGLQQAQLIALAAERGHFSVALRNPDDQRTMDGIPDLGENALGEARGGGPIAARTAATGPVRLKDSPVGGALR
jgi:pilus assembly protein CpaB